MEEDGNGSPCPTTFRVESHRDSISNDHAREVDHPKNQQGATKLASRRNHEAFATRETQADLPVEKNDDDLKRQEIPVGEQSRRPLLHRGQEPTPTNGYQHLPQDSQHKKEKQHPQLNNQAIL